MGQWPEIGRKYEIKNKAAITLQCKLNGKLIAALLVIPCSRPRCRIHRTTDWASWEKTVSATLISVKDEIT